MEIYIINGYTSNIGQWELEVFRELEDAEYQFKSYVDDYCAEVSGDGHEATCDEGRFWIQTVEI